MNTRFASIEDLVTVGEMYLRGLKELKEPHDEDLALDYVLHCWSCAPCILLQKNDQIIGFAGLNSYQPRISKNVYLRDYMFFIEPGHRGVRAWRALCKAVQKVSDDLKIPFVGEHRLTGSIEQHQRLIRMAGARPFAIMTIYGDHQ